MKNFHLLVFLLVAAVLQIHTANGQQGNIWAFGYREGLDFSSGTPVPIRTAIEGYGEANASVCDAKGSLLFYTTGDRIWDKSNNIMLNGDSLTGLPNFNSTSPFAAPSGSCTQGTLIAPMPGSVNKYYVFSLSSLEMGSLYGRLYYSIVDMELNGGLGGVTRNSKGILLDSGLTEKMTAIVGDRCNIWLLLHAEGTNAFRAWEIRTDGIKEQPVISETGNDNQYIFYSGGMLVASPDRKKILACNNAPTHSGIELFDFDPGTGKVSNPVLLEKNRTSPFYGGCFSPDNTKVYVTGSYILFQYDLSSSNPSESKVELGGCGGGHIKLAPDGKIYTLGGLNPSTLSVISFPNNGGLSCQFSEDAIELTPFQLGPRSPWSGLPNVVPIIQRDTFGTTHIVQAPCFTRTLPIQVPNAALGWDYLWQDGVSGSLRNVDRSGRYWVSYYKPSCIFNVDTFDITFSNGVLPAIEIRPSCKGARNGNAFAFTYLGDTVKYYYTWLDTEDHILSTSDTLRNVSSGTYTLEVNTAECDTSFEFYIQEEDYRVAFDSDTLICEGDNIAFTNYSDEHFKQWYWSFGDGDTSLVASPMHVYTDSGTYTVTLTGYGAVCKDTAYRTLIVDAPAEDLSFTTDHKAICQGEAIHFTPTIKGMPLQMHWFFGDQSYLEKESLESLQHAYDSTGRLWVSLKASFRACPDLFFGDSIHIQALPGIDLGPDAFLCLGAQPLLLENHSTYNDIQYAYLWSTGDTTKQLKIVQPGIYSLRLMESHLGCTSTESIVVRKDCYLDIPNAFSPNGDGVNDYFFPRQLLAKGVRSFDMQVLNRWGQMVFRTQQLNGRGWDGSYSGQEQPQGTYVYRIAIEFDNKQQENYQGNVTLVR